MILILAVLLAFVAVTLAAWALLGGIEERSTVRASLRQLEGYEVTNVRDQEMLKPVAERAIAPVLEGLVRLGKRFTPVDYMTKTRMKFSALGHVGTKAVDRFMAVRFVAQAATIPLVLFVIFSVPIGGLPKFVMAGLIGVLCLFGADIMLNRRVEERKIAIQRKLPDMLDLLVISVEAGLGFEQALQRSVDNVPGELSKEFTRMLGEVRAGASRSDAMRNMEARVQVPELRSFVLAIIQADTFGVSIGRVLRAQAEEMRIKRRQLAQERAQKAPVKMLIPMVFCVFPALFIVVLAPAGLSITETLGKT